ncbi:MAG: diphthamide synthesis protein [Candidatus Altiarchaeota archaeon]
MGQGYDFETRRVIEEIRKSGHARVGLQFPEGLKQHALEIASEIESETGVEVVIMTDQTYGACDVKSSQAEKMGLDLLVHYGHTRLMPGD